MNLDTLIEPIQSSFVDMWADIAALFPKIIAGVVILLVGYCIAAFSRKIIGTTLQKINFDDLLEKVGAARVFKKIGLSSSPSLLIAKAIFWLFLLFIIKNAADKVGIEDISKLIESIIVFLPKVVTSVIIMLVGFMVADTLQNAVHNTLKNLDLDYAKPLSNILFGFVFVIVLTVSLSQLGIETELLNSSVKIILGALGLAAAVALGLGLRTLAKAVVSGVYARDIYKVGTEIEIDGELAKVAGVGPVTTKLQRQDGGFIMVPNEELVAKVVKGRSAE